MLQKNQIKNINWCVFTLLFLTLLIKNICFHGYVFHSFLISTIIHNPLAFMRFWSGKIIAPLLLSGIVFFTRRYWWTIILNLIIDTWIIANLFYYKANALFLSFENMKMADNLSGFWDSLLVYMGWDIISILFLTIIYSTIILILSYPYTDKKAKAQPRTGLIIIFLAFILDLANILIFNINNYNREKENWNKQFTALQNSDTKKSKPKTSKVFRYLYPFGSIKYLIINEGTFDTDALISRYIKQESIISYFPGCLMFHVWQPQADIIELSETDENEIKKYIKQTEGLPQPNSNLIFIMVESLESWAIEQICETQFMPNLNTLTKSDHVLFCKQIKSEVRHGNSADGQMIDITGILPIAQDATCMLFCNNSFPSYAECYSNSAIINPAPGVWRQSILTFNYNFKQLIEPKSKGDWEDRDVIKSVINYVDTISEPFCVLGITLTSHVPFTYGAHNVMHKIENMPQQMSDYLNSLCYTDSCIGTLIDKIMNSNLAQNTTLVITGDHNIFRVQNREFDLFATRNGINLQTGNTYVPLIVYSPQIESNITLEEPYLQMDTYRTILHIIGCQDYYWQGFGVNLLDKNERTNRQITEQNAYRLSDLILRSNYFKK